ncbi:AAA family ATPase [Crossiella sp. CA-258035]|uniref:AAA family ATPase n=1 Tax=Crossiella sp. CA-258035 TaxID=2981138 RepID=UPI0024BCD40E|nr:AAA family ATPase [Crossiella sp. CA-258035]WHT17554.1 AAA family ATPase [Crossiella sp. CA-258035]
MPNGAETRARIESYLLARIPFVTVRTVERSRALDMLGELARIKQLDILVHTLSQGLRDLRTRQPVTDDRSLLGALDLAGEWFQSRSNLTIVFTDVQHLSEDNDISRRFSDLATLAEEHGGSMVVITSDPVWTPLQRMGMAVSLDLPDMDEMRAEIESFLRPYSSDIPIEWGSAEYDQAASILAGVTKIEALNILATLVVKRSVTKDDLPGLSRAKDAIFNELAGLERVTLRDGDHRVGGLAGLRQWLDRKRPLLTMDLRDRGMRPPRGILLVGVPGCGKSLSAKAIAADWQLPLYRLDMASVFGHYVGQSEGRLRDALATADTVAPCVLWIDEIEKGLAGSGSDSTGITTRLVGQFLYWLQESRARVFVVATANDTRSLPPELLRSGRFDDMFFVDLPDQEERREIIGIYLGKYLRVPVAREVVDELVVLSEGFAGSDLQSAVAEIGYEAIRVGDDAVPVDYYYSAFRNVVPLLRSAPERVEEVRQLRDRAIPASGKARPSTDRTVGARRVVLG